MKNFFKSPVFIIMFNIVILILLNTNSLQLLNLWSFSTIFDYYSVYYVILIIFNMVMFYFINYPTDIDNDYSNYDYYNYYTFIKIDLFSKKTWYYQNLKTGEKIQYLDFPLNYIECFDWIEKLWLSKNTYYKIEDTEKKEQYNKLKQVYEQEKEKYNKIVKNVCIYKKTLLIITWLIFITWVFSLNSRISEDNIKTSYEKHYTNIDKSINDFYRINNLNKEILTDLQNKRVKYLEVYNENSSVIQQLDKDIQEIKDKIK